MQKSFQAGGFMLAAAIVAVSGAGGAHAEEVKSLRGKVSSDQILEALSSTPAGASGASAPAAPNRRRGLSLSSDEAAAPPAAPMPVAAPAQPVAAQPPSVPVAAQPAAAQPAPASPAVAVAAAQPVLQAAPQAAAMEVISVAPPAPRRYAALDLEIPFQLGSEQLTNEGRDVLDQLATALKSERLSAARAIILEGHADATGNAKINQALSFRRAQSARSYLSTRHGLPDGKLRAVGKGSTEPADPANPASEINRRVRVILEL